MRVPGGESNKGRFKGETWEAFSKIKRDAKTSRQAYLRRSLDSDFVSQSSCLRI